MSADKTKQLDTVDTITDKRMVKILENAYTIRKYLDAVEAEALRRLKAGGTIEGLKLVEGRSSRKWSIPDDEVEAKLRKMGVPKEEIYEKSLIGVAKAEKLKWVDKKTALEEGLSIEQTEMIERNYVVRIPGRTMVVFASDHRKEVKPILAPSVQHMFGAVETEPTEPFKLFKD